MSTNHATTRTLLLATILLCAGPMTMRATALPEPVFSYQAERDRGDAIEFQGDVRVAREGILGSVGPMHVSHCRTRVSSIRRAMLFPDTEGVIDV